jgi:uridine phosphorylase
LAETFESAEIVKTEEGKQYHVGVKPGDIAPFILLCGEPQRADRVAKHFSEITVRRANREYVTITGVFEGAPVTVCATGIGTDNTEIAIIEISQCVENPTFIRIGSSGALKPNIQLGDLVISSGAAKLEATSNFFVREGFPALAHHEVLIALIEAAGRLGVTHHVGITATACGFYGAQGRKVPGFPVRYPDLPEELERMGASNFEMEASLLFTLAGLSGSRAGAVCAVYANRHLNKFIDTDTKQEAEARCIETGLEAVKILRAMDKAKAERKYWKPSDGL